MVGIEGVKTPGKDQALPVFNSVVQYDCAEAAYFSGIKDWVDVPTEETEGKVDKLLRPAVQTFEKMIFTILSEKEISRHLRVRMVASQVLKSEFDRVDYFRSLAPDGNFEESWEGTNRDTLETRSNNGQTLHLMTADMIFFDLKDMGYRNREVSKSLSEEYARNALIDMQELELEIIHK